MGFILDFPSSRSYLLYMGNTMKTVIGSYIGMDGRSHRKYGETIEVPAGTPTRKSNRKGCVQVLVGNWRTVEVAS